MHNFKRYLYNEVSLVIAVIGITVGVVNYINNPQKIIEAEFSKHQALQEQNDLAISQQLKIIQEGDLKDLKADILENRNELTSLKNEIVKLETIINERIPKR